MTTNKQTHSNDKQSVQHEALYFECRNLLTLGRYQSTITLVNSKTGIHPNAALLPFYKGYALQKLESFEQALQSYDACLDLDPECEEAWHNKVLILEQLQRYDEANFHLVKCCQLSQGDLQDHKAFHSPEASQIKLLGAASGLFGEIEVLQTINTRYLTIDEEREGSFWLVNGQPDNMPSSDYTAGLLPAACHFNANHSPTTGLILGLGAGAGIIALLTNFKQLHLSVVEIDPSIIELACRHFPLLMNYIEAERLTVICQDGLDYVAHSKASYDFVLLDIYAGDHTFARKLRTRSFLTAIGHIAKLVGVNLLPLEDKMAYDNVIKDFARAGIGLKICYPTGRSGGINTPCQNRWLYSQVIEDVFNFDPYPSSPDYLRKAFCRDYKMMVSRCEAL